STRFTAQVRGLGVAIRNANDGISLAQTAEGALGAMTESLQRLRELALQSANATNSDSDRQALNAEASQLISELARVSDQTNFNGRKLLDGSFSSSVQIGTNVGETVEFAINEVSVENLGGGIGAGISAVGDANAIGNGDLIINGVAITPSSATDDAASTDNADASAISKVAAINRFTSETGVRAEANENVVAGSAITASATAGTITINDIAISVNTTDDATTTRAAVVAAINTVSDQTGVTAIDSGDSESGVSLVAADGRNIEVAFTTVSETTTGVVAAGTYEGGYTLVSEDGSDIVLAGGDGSATGDIGNAGLVAGTFGGTTAAVASVGQAADTGSVNALVAGDVVINGVSIGASLATDDTASNSDNAGSGIALAAAINRSSDQSGVSASVNATTLVGGTAQSVTTVASEAITINGVATADISTDTNLADDTNRAIAIDAINLISGQTGVIASDNGTTITLTAADGRNISVGVESEALGDAVGLDASATSGVYLTAGTVEVVTSTVTLESAGSFEITAGTSNGDSGVTNVGLEQGEFGGASSGQFLTEVDLSTVAGAEDALSAIDNALDAVNRERANLGAIQNRLDSTVTSLAINVENLTAARSRILDADFAVETAELSRTQVLQQAGVSILAQANAQPQLVLSLLQ
ncbi:MAG: flagellin, partial [Pseudomonadota bacterium]